ncbi:MAG: hypothetical protein V3569_05680 [Acholeplasmataceae bacterium]|nr:hypothetical protein [Acholeplasmataceae bacterium]
MKIRILTFLIFILIPTFFGGFLFFIFSNIALIELSYFIFAVIGLIIAIGRANRNDRLNMQEYGTTKVDKTTEIHKEFRSLQIILLISSITNLILAYLAFVISGGIS